METKTNTIYFVGWGKDAIPTSVVNFAKSCLAGSLVNDLTSFTTLKFTNGLTQDGTQTLTGTAVCINKQTMLALLENTTVEGNNPHTEIIIHKDKWESFSKQNV